MIVSLSRKLANCLLACALAALFACCLAAPEAHAQDMKQNVTWSRLAGSNAYGTMTAIVEKGWKTSDTVVIAAFDGYWDALSASSLAGQAGAPVLLTGRNALASDTSALIKKLKAKNAYVVGGSYWIPDKVVNQLKNLGLKVTRVSGKTAAATSVQVAKKLTGSKKKIAIVATDISYHDALASSPFSYAQRVPIFLTENGGKRLPSDAVNAMKNGRYSVVIVGGTSSVSAAVASQLSKAGLAVDRISGNNAYETAEKFARWSVGKGMKWSKLGVATVASHYDALTGGALCGKQGGVLLLGDDFNNKACVKIAGDNKKTIGSAFVYGGSASVGESTLAKLKSATMSPVADKLLNPKTWNARMPIPSDEDILDYRTDRRSPYIVCRPEFSETIGYYEYAVDFKVDSQPNGTYLSIGNWDMDMSSLKSRYSNVHREYGGVAAYAGFQVLDDGSKVAIMSVWDTYVTDANGKEKTIRAKKTYPANPRVSQEFGGEGVGVQTIVDYDWQLGKSYRALIQCGTTSQGNCELAFWVCDLATGRWDKLVAYDLGFGDTYMKNACCFLENYVPSTAPRIRTMELSNFRVNSREAGKWVSATSARMEENYEHPGSYAYGSDGACFWAITSGIPNLCTAPANGTRYYVTEAESGSPY